jgi:hypothetical protein
MSKVMVRLQDHELKVVGNLARTHTASKRP